MKTEQLINHFNGSFLKEQYLEAFLVQSAFIEGLIKSYTDFNFYLECKDIIDASPILDASLKKIDKYSLLQLTDLLYSAEHITRTQKKLLDDYRIQRNKVIHHLLKNMSDKKFDAELKKAYEVGEKILTNQRFKQIITLQKNYEENRGPE